MISAQSKQEKQKKHVIDVSLVSLLLALVLLLINFIKQIITGLVPSLTRLRKHGSELKFFVLIFQKLNEIDIQHHSPTKIVTHFLIYYFSYVQSYKAALIAAINVSVISW